MDSAVIGPAEADVLEDTIEELLEYPEGSVNVPEDSAPASTLRARRLAVRDVVFDVELVVAADEDPEAVYNAAKTTLETSVTNGDFTTTLNTKATEQNVESLQTATAESITVDAPHIEPVSPTPSPTPSPDKNDGSGGIALKGNTLIAVIAACVAVPALLVIGSVVYIKFGQAQPKLSDAQKPTRGLDLRALSAHALGGERERPSNMFADDVADDLLVVQQMSKK